MIVLIASLSGCAYITKVHTCRAYVGDQGQYYACFCTADWSDGTQSIEHRPSKMCKNLARINPPPGTVKKFND